MGTLPWDRFLSQGDERGAFEAFAGHLFRNYARRELGCQDVRFVCGDGGDGGVEAYAELPSGDEIGLQAKWFRSPLRSTQWEQIKDSVTRAKAVHSRLQRYVVALPRDLGDDRGRGQKTERDRWQALLSAERSAGLELQLWDETTLSQELAHGADALHQYWFPHAAVAGDLLRRAFELQKSGWLDRRYTPNLYVARSIDEHMDLHVGAHLALAGLASDASDLVTDIERVQRSVTEAGNDLSNPPEATELRDRALDELAQHRALAQDLLERARAGSFGSPPSCASTRSLTELLRWLESSRSPQSDLRRLPMELRLFVTSTHGTLRQRVLDWPLAHRPLLLSGPPGSGKTAAMARAVETHLAERGPAILIRAKDSPPRSWETLLQAALGRPDASLDMSVASLVASAIRADVRRAGGKPSAAGAPTGVLVCVDGLEEAGALEKWAERLGEAEGLAAREPRLRFVATVRDLPASRLRRHLRSGAVREMALRGEEALPLLIERYATVYEWPASLRRFHWALRDPLSVRLLCDLREESSVETPDALTAPDLSLTRLLTHRLLAAEQQLASRLAYAPELRLAHRSLLALARVWVGTPRIPVDQALGVIGSALHGSEQSPDALLRGLGEQHLTYESVRESLGMGVPQRMIEPAFDPLVDHLIGHVLAHESNSSAATEPALLAQRPDALEHAAVMMLENGTPLHASERWPSLDSDRRETAALRALVHVDPSSAGAHAPWVRERLLATMPSCRRVLRELVSTVAFDPGHPLGSSLAHQAFVALTVAERDLVLSGPRLLPSPGGEPWSGLAQTSLENLSLEPEEEPAGRPVLLAWALASVDRRTVRHAQEELTRWALSGPLSRWVAWLEQALQSNDPQMKQEVMIAAYRVACLTTNADELAVLAHSVGENVLEPEGRFYELDAVMLHAAQGIVERARYLGVSVPPPAASHHMVSRGGTLPLEPSAGLKAGAHDGMFPLDYDLARYVVGAGIRPFFTPELTTVWTPEVALLAKAANLPSLSPEGVAHGFIHAMLARWGWTREAFYGEPKGGDASERLGADIAIIRRYTSASHGSRSSVASFGEKYVWAALPRLLAFLAARLPWKDWDVEIPPPVALAPLVESWMAESALLVGALCARPAGLTVWELGPVRDLAPSDIHIEAGDPRVRANQWVRRTPVEVEILQRYLSPRVPPSKDDDWLTLHGLIVAVEPDTGGQTELLVTAVTLDRDALESVRQWPELDWNGDVIHSTARPVGTYHDPTEALWAPWVEENSEEIPILRMGKRVGALRSLVCTTTFVDRGRERTVYMPAQRIRHATRLVRYSDGMMTDATGNIAAWYREAPERELARCPWSALIMKTASLHAALREGQAVAWLAHMLRMPSGRVYADAEDDRIVPARFDRRWLVLPGDPPRFVPLDLGGACAPLHTTHTSAPRAAGVLSSATNPGAGVPLDEVFEDDSTPYFLWDEPMTVRELRHRLATASQPERDRLLGKILREARDTEVWDFTTPEEVANRWSGLQRHLGRRRGFWAFLFERWRREGLVA